MDYLTYLVLLIFGILGFMLKPLIIMSLLKVKFGQKVLIQWYPFEGFVTQLRKNLKKYGDVMYEDKLTFTTHPHVEVKLINTARGDVIYEFFRSAHIKFILNNQKLYKKIDVPFGERFFQKGIAFQEGEDWKISRRILSKSFEFQQLKSRIPLVMTLCRYAFKYEDSQQVNIIDDALRIAGEIVTQTFFTSNFNQVNNEKSFTLQVYECMLNILVVTNESKWTIFLKHLIFENNRTMPNILTTTRQKYYLNKLEGLKGNIREIIEQRLKGPEHPNDFLQAYVDEMRINPQITMEHAVQQYLILLFTGIDTTSNLFGLCCYALSIHTDVQDKLRKSIKETINQYDELSSENINKMAYLNAFIDECLRMYSPVPGLIGRVAVEDHYIGEYYIRKNTNIHVNLLPNNFNEEIYQNPNEFIPDRWINNNNVEPYQFTPFSAGPRNCIGQHLSMIELKCMLIYLILNYRIEKGVDHIHRTFEFVYTILDRNFIRIQKIK